MERLLDLCLDDDGGAVSSELFFPDMWGNLCRTNDIPDAVGYEVVLLNAAFLSG